MNNQSSETIGRLEEIRKALTDLIEAIAADPDTDRADDFYPEYTLAPDASWDADENGLAVVKYVTAQGDERYTIAHFPADETARPIDLIHVYIEASYHTIEAEPLDEIRIDAAFAKIYAAAWSKAAAIADEYAPAHMRYMMEGIEDQS